MSQVGSQAEVSHDFRDIISWANTKVTASMSTMFLCCGSSGRVGIVDMFAVTFVFKTSGTDFLIIASGLETKIAAQTSWRRSQQVDFADKSFLCFCVEVVLLANDIIIPKPY